MKRSVTKWFLPLLSNFISLGNYSFLEQLICLKYTCNNCNRIILKKNRQDWWNADLLKFSLLFCGHCVVVDVMKRGIAVCLVFTAQRKKLADWRFSVWRFNRNMRRSAIERGWQIAKGKAKSSKTYQMSALSDAFGFENFQPFRPIANAKKNKKKQRIFILKTDEMHQASQWLFSLNFNLL